MRRLGPLLFLLWGGLLLWRWLPEILVNSAATGLVHYVGDKACAHCLEETLTSSELALRMRPGLQRALYLRAEAFFFAGETVEAVNLLKANDDWPPRNDPVRAMLTEALARQAEWVLVNELLANWDVCKGTLAANLHQGGQAYENVGEVENARAAYLAAFYACPKEEVGIRALLHLSQTAAQQGRLTEAIRYYRLLVTTSPASASALADFANVLLQANAPEEALTMAERAVASDPDYLGGYAMRGLAHYARGELKLAISDFEFVVRRSSPDPSPDILWVLAQAYYRSGLRNETMATLKKLLESKPDFQPARDLLNALQG